MTRKKKSQPELKIVFDTSVLFTQVASDLVKNEIRTVIAKNARHNDLTIRWYLPEIVLDERRYQMESRAFELLPSIAKLEKLLGHNLNITEEILVHRVDEAIQRQLAELGISSLTIDTSVIDWNALIKRSVYRHPPFEPGEKEKGFRDSIIAESFRQLVKQSPATSAICRLVMITEDHLLAEYILDITKDSKNVKVLSTINELENLINTLISEVTEDFLSALSEQIDKYFFDRENKETLYYKEHIRDKVNEQYSEELKSIRQAIPQAGLLRENGTWYISKPVFIKKDKQRLYWVTPIRVEARLYKYEIAENVSGGLRGIASLTPEVEQRGGLRALTLGDMLPSKKVEIASGQSNFEIHWSVNITPSKKLTAPRVEKISFVSTTWGET
jgi:hypothetical protein